MNGTPRNGRIHLAFLGRCNVGKSSLVNALLGQEASLVSPDPGTTSDPVSRACEMPGVGPVLFIDTAGLDDSGALGARRAARSLVAVAHSDIAVLVARESEWGVTEESVLRCAQAQGTPVLVAFSQCDRDRAATASAQRSSSDRTADAAPSSLPRASARNAEAATPASLLRFPAPIRTSSLTGLGLEELRQAIARLAASGRFAPPPLVQDLVPAGGLAVFVVPVDPEAPQGRLILPQVQAIRDCLDGGASTLVVREQELRAALQRLHGPPALVVTDSQAFAQVAAVVPDEVPLTSFSILMARRQGDLASFAAGARGIDALRPGDRILVAEACTHHQAGDDIGRVKIPRWLRSRVAGDLCIEHVQGSDFPADLGGYRLVIHCGGCMANRRAMLARQESARSAGVAMTNYGMAIAWMHGIFDRALRLFPEAR